jgi:neutral ceramidase
LRKLVVRKLRELLPTQEESEMYTEENTMISATHTHASPGGFADDFLYQITNFGIVKGEREAIAMGVVKAILNAHEDLKRDMRLGEGQGQGEGDLVSGGSFVEVRVGELKNATINRSVKSYMHNPAEERARYKTNKDDMMVMLNVWDEPKEGEKGETKLRGSANWFAVHGVSMNKTNPFISGDNKGVASYLVSGMKVIALLTFLQLEERL